MSSLPPTSPVKGHTRTSSTDERRVSVPRRRTKGPLDLGDPPFKDHPPPTPPAAAAISPPTSPTVPKQQMSSGLFDMHPPTISRDFSYLLHPQNFHPLPQHTIPAAFRTSAHQPTASTSLHTLLSTGHFRAAAITAANQLTNSTSPTPLTAEEIFKLWYIRLSSLMLIGSTSTAAQEIKVFSDLGSNFYRDSRGGHLVPWGLRVLAVRLQAIGVSDWRRSIALYYELAREARSEILKREAKPDSPEHNAEEIALWRGRLRDLGIRVASALVEMGDLAAASRHLEGLRVSADDHELKAVLCLLYVRIGNLAAAKQALPAACGEDVHERILCALILMGEAKWAEAAAAWKEISDTKTIGEGGDMASNNLAVCLLYMGDLKEARGVLESLIDSGTSFTGLTFNLSTIYELCSDNSKMLKASLAERVAAQGKEMTSASFKM
ncbi:hypothetical protein B9Z19DRAFT_1043333 [Tuber borchii]|uniref:Tetratricopeptide repeat-domain-containing protein n=1 Tax=Tuber borchii TaxID=42251 RepID=A0A2T7A0Q0_TUBBO|nr:hypothetical protein B9Z19DRAFT_1043333 [Tuber borchii]